MVADVTTRIAVMRELFFEVPRLLLELGVIEFKCLVLRAKYSIRRFERRIFVIRERNSLAKYRSRAMLGNQFFEAVEQSHVDTPNGHDERRQHSPFAMTPDVSRVRSIVLVCVVTVCSDQCSGIETRIPGISSIRV